MTQVICNQESPQELFSPIQVRVMTKQETKEYHLKKLYELSVKSLGQNSHFGVRNYEQKRKVKATGRRCCY